MSFLGELNAALAQANFQYVVEESQINTGYIRFDLNGGRQNGWIIAYEEGGVGLAAFGDFRSGFSKKLDIGDSDPKKLLKLKNTLRQAKFRLKQKARESIEALWPDLLTAGEHAYLQRKKIRLHGARLECFPGTLTIQNIVIPMSGDRTTIENIQRISEQGEKGLFPGGETQGVGFWIGSETPKVILICEGYATGASIYEALDNENILVVCAMSTSNLSFMGEVVKNKYPGCSIIFVADNDFEKEENVGLSSAVKASAIIPGSKVVTIPPEDGSSDCNDYALTHGNEKLKELLEKEININDLVILEKSVSVAQKKPNENQVAHLISKNLPNLCVLEEEIFEYCTTHWKRWGDLEEVGLRNEIRRMSGGMYKTSDVNSCLQAVLDLLPRGPDSLLYPKLTMANFKNGTLHLKETRNSHTFEFRPHDPKDGLLSVIPFDFSDELFTKVNTQWEVTLKEKLFPGDEDADEKILALSEMFGAAIMPRYPHLFMLHGTSGCGKSTVIMTAKNFIREEDIGAVDPTRFGREFYLEPLVGKTVNIVTDICTTQPISDDIIKQIEDQAPFFVNRKGKKAIRAPLPPVHIFGGNDIPKTLDGASGAHERRWTFIKFNTKVATNDNYDRNFSKWLFEAGPEGILGFALRGLQSLLSRKGVYTQPASGSSKMREWQMETDSVAQYLLDVSDGNVQHVRLDPVGEIPASKLWTSFKAWAEDTNSGAQKMSQTTFFSRLTKNGYTKKKTKLGYAYPGFSTEKMSSHEF